MQTLLICGIGRLLHTKGQGATAREVTTALAENEGVVVSVHDLQALRVVVDELEDLVSGFALHFSKVGGHIDHSSPAEGVVTHEAMIGVASFLAVDVTLLERNNIDLVELLCESDKGNTLTEFDGDRLIYHNVIRFNC